MTSTTLEDALTQTLSKYWGFREFRANQLEVCTAIIGGRDAFVLAATGSGKSLCFQLPPLALTEMGTRATTIVVSPLLSLIEDQILSLRARGIAAGLVGGDADEEEEARACAGDFRIVYITPEKLEYWAHGLREMAQNVKIAGLCPWLWYTTIQNFFSSSLPLAQPTYF